MAQGASAAALGRTDEAEGLFQRAIAAKQPPLDTKEHGDWLLPGMVHKSIESLVELARARILLDQDKIEEAAAALDRVEEADLVGEEIGIETLRARLDLRRGEAEKAFRRLKKSFLKERSCQGSVEGCTLLAIAARVAGHPEEGKKAEEMARSWGADLRVLDSPP